MDNPHRPSLWGPGSQQKPLRLKGFLPKLSLYTAGVLFPLQEQVKLLFVYTLCVGARLCVDTNEVALVDEHRYVYGGTSFKNNLF